MKNISILEFIKTGSFGGVKLGMTDQEVINLLGPPEDRLDSVDAFIFSYGWWEIHFLTANANKAYLIQNDHLLYDCINHNEMIQFENEQVKIQSGFIKPFQHVRLKEVMAILEENGIDFNLVHKEFQPILQLQNRVRMDFTDQEPVVQKEEGFSWGPGRGQELEEGEQRVEKLEDLILYYLSIYNPDLMKIV